jgi:hypothetical protein
VLLSPDAWESEHRAHLAGGRMRGRLLPLAPARWRLGSTTYEAADGYRWAIFRRDA